MPPNRQENRTHGSGVVVHTWVIELNVDSDYQRLHNVKGGCQVLCNLCMHYYTVHKTEFEFE